jgi:hypothetical protein
VLTCTSPDQLQQDTPVEPHQTASVEPQHMAPVEPQQDTSLPSLGEIVEQILRTREPPPTIPDLARAPPERRWREGFFRPRTLPRIRIPDTECFGDRSLRREQQHDPGPKESTSSESAFDSMTSNTSSILAQGEGSSNGGAAHTTSPRTVGSRSEAANANQSPAANMPGPSAVASDFGAADEDQGPRCDECRQRGIFPCTHPSTTRPRRVPTPLDPMRQVQSSEEPRQSEEDEDWIDAQESLDASEPQSSDDPNNVMSRTRPVNRGPSDLR